MSGQGEYLASCLRIPNLERRDIGPDHSHPIRADEEPPSVRAEDHPVGEPPKSQLLFQSARMDVPEANRIVEASGDQLRSVRRKQAQIATAAQATLTSLQQRAVYWMTAAVGDEVLRLVLWMRLREAFDLPPQTFGTLRSARTAAPLLRASFRNWFQPRYPYAYAGFRLVTES